MKNKIKTRKHVNNRDKALIEQHSQGFSCSVIIMLLMYNKQYINNRQTTQQRQYNNKCKYY